MRQSTIVAVLTLVLIAAGCGGGGGAPLAAGVDDLVDMGLVSQADIEKAEDGQLDVFADGELTRGEYVAQFEATVQCMRNLGVKIVDGPDWQLEQLVFFYGDVEDPDRQKADDAAFAECWSKHAKLVYERWSVDHEAEIAKAIETEQLSNP